MRSSPTDNKGRTHTSLITVAVYKYREPVEITINNSDLEFRYLRAFGKGGQRSNKVETGCIIKHLPTNIEAKSTSDRSQHINKQLAMEELKLRLSNFYQNTIDNQVNNNRSDLIGTGHRSDKVRTIRVNDNTVKCEITGMTKSFKDYSKGYIDFK